MVIVHAPSGYVTADSLLKTALSHYEEMFFESFFIF